MVIRAMRFGTNYVPSQGWWYAWQDWNKDAIRRDMAALRELGLDHIRAHLIWPMFQPNESYVSSTCLKHLVELLDLADEAQLDVWPSVLDGWLSGFAFSPAWLNKTSQHEAWNMFTSREAIDAEKHLFSEIANGLKGHPRLAGLDLGNELGVMAFFGHDCTTIEADAWGEEIMAHVESELPGLQHVNGADHSHWFANKHFSREHLAASGSLTALHCWANFTGALDQSGAFGTSALNLIPFMAEFARAYHKDPNRQIWIQEFGMAESWFARAKNGREEDVPRFIEETIRNSWQTPNLFGFTTWCSHALDKSLKGFEQGEYELGLLDLDNKRTETGRVFAELISEWRKNPLEPIATNHTIMIPENFFDGKAHWPPNWDAGALFMKAREAGLYPDMALPFSLRP